jgi:hypothetical protein
MSDAAERVEAWRRAKRQAGYRPVMLWLPIAVKSDLDALAYTRGQDISACVEDAIHALASSQGSRKPLRLDTQQLHQLKDEIAAYVMGRLSEPGTPSPADAPQEPSPPAERPRRAKTGGNRRLRLRPSPPSVTSAGSTPACPSPSWPSICMTQASTGPPVVQGSPCR